MLKVKIDIESSDDDVDAINRILVAIASVTSGVVVNTRSKRLPVKVNSNSADFYNFWFAYPRKVGKGAAEKAFAKIPEDQIPAVMSALEKQKQSDQWKKNNGVYIPHPCTWINQRRWEDGVQTDADGFEISTGDIW